jgi:hypothetical protein
MRPTTTPVPGQFDQWSVASGPSHIGFGLSRTPLDSTSTTSTDSHAFDVPLRPRTPSELKYLTLPLTSDVQQSAPAAPVDAQVSRPQLSVDVRRQNAATRTSHLERQSRSKAAHDVDDKPAVNSGLTTPTSNPRSQLDEEDRPRIHSGLTTPEHLHAPLKIPIPEVSTTAGGKTPLKQPAPAQPAAVHLTLAAASPTVSMPIPQPQLTPMIIPPVSEIPNIPTPDDVKREKEGTPLPSFQPAVKAPSPIEDDVSSIGGSVIAGKRDTIIAKADELRKLAKDAEAERDRLRNELRKAEREKRHLDVVCLQVEYEEAQENINNLHAKAARRYYKGGHPQALI